MSEKWVCPACGAKKPMVKEIDDKSRPPIITGSGMRPMYHKKMQCGNCGHEWVPEEF
ncbi:hypothetical protein GF325_04380 [Candidatus Bathyarchaeota archaeon]|nr:hypothetical protein [Candidatus Bathyarchaeota archaeon]